MAEDENEPEETAELMEKGNYIILNNIHDQSSLPERENVKLLFNAVPLRYNN